MELDEALNKWYLDVVKTAKLSIKEQADVTSSGAKVMSKHISDVTRQKHFNVHRKGDVKHLSDSIDYLNRNVDGEFNGHSSVGFQTKDEAGINHARIARFLNDGTKNIKADHFYDNAVEEAKEPAFTAQGKKLSQIINKKWNEE